MKFSKFWSISCILVKFPYLWLYFPNFCPYIIWAQSYFCPQYYLWPQIFISSSLHHLFSPRTFPALLITPAIIGVQDCNIYKIFIHCNKYMFSQNIMMYVGVLCFSVNAGLFTFPMMSLIPIGYWIDDVIAVGGAWSPIFSWDQLTWAQSTEHRFCRLCK